MRMRVKKLVGVLFILCFALGLFAQVDSTFVRYYYPTSQTLPIWAYFPLLETQAANVIETYDGNFALQTMATLHTPPPEWLFSQSPMILYSRNGEYQSTLFGPQVDGDIVEGYYTRIVKDGQGGYLALDSEFNILHRLDRNLMFVEMIQLYCDEGQIGYVYDILPDDNGFIVLGYIGGTNNDGVVKLDDNLTAQWINYQQYTTGGWPLTGVIPVTSGGFLHWYGGYNHFYANRLSTTGDTLWIKNQITPNVSSIVEVNNRYYGLRYEGMDNSGSLLVYDFGIDFAIEHPESPIHVIPTYQLLEEDVVFPTIRTSDNCIVLAVSTPVGEIHKFDSGFNPLWSSNALPPERIGIGKQPMIELGNGDILYCARVLNGASSLTERLALVRINSAGNFVGIEDDTEQTPAPSLISAYPNPFSNAITLSTSKRVLPTSKFKIYNIKGQQVESMDIIDNSVTWTPKGVPSGLYIVKLVKGNKTIANRLVTYIK